MFGYRSILLSLSAMACSDAGVTKFNSEPQATITSPADGAEVLAGTTLAMTGSVSDPNHEATELSVTWYLGDAVACPSAPPADDGSTACEAAAPAADAELRLEVRDSAGATGVARAALTVLPNSPPEARILAPDAAGVYYADQLITFEGEVSDTEDPAETLTVWWESSLTGALGVEAAPTSTGEILGYDTLDEGEHAIELHVLDSAGNEAVESVTIEVGAPNSAPSCAITAPLDGSSGEEGALITFRGTATDVDVAADWLSVTWSSDKDGPIGTSTPDSSGNVLLASSALSVNTHVITMQVEDEVGATCSALMVYTVGSPPTISLEAPLDGEVVNEGESLAFLATVADGEDRPSDLVVRWESNIDGLLREGAPDSDGTSQFLDAGLSVGDHALTVTVTDSDGFYASALRAFTVNGAPSAPLISLSPDPAASDDDLRVNLDRAAIDPEGATLSYFYAWSVDGTPSSASASALLPASATTRGQRWSVEVTATDGLATSAAATAALTIANTAPTLAALSLSPDPAYAGDILVCTAGATADLDGDTVGLSYDWTVAGSTLGYNSDTLDDSFFARGDTVTCTATPTDGLDDGAPRSSNTITIGNTAPFIAAVSVNPTSPTVTSTLTCTYTGFQDADGDSDHTTYAWTIGGRSVGTAATLTGAFASGDLVTCTVTPGDGTDLGTPLASTVTIGNTAPVLASVTLSPDPATEGDTLTCTPGLTTDADGTTSFTYTYDWTVNGSTIATTTRTLTGASFSAGDDVTCLVTPRDATDAGPAVASNTVTIANTGPVLSAVTVTPSTGAVGDTLTCAAAATDADGDTVTLSYRWSSGATGATLTLSAANNPGDVLTCTATAADPSGASDTGTASATVRNTNPVVSATTVSPSTARVGDTLTCAANATDADGGSPTLTYAWSTGATGATLTVTAAQNPGDILTCTATATDTDGGSGTGSATATVLNTNPTLSAVSISPSTAYNNDLLTCAATAADADGGSPALSYVWTNTSDSTTIGSGATLSLTSVLAGSLENIACTVTATDTDGGTATGAASLTLGNRAPVATASLTPTSATRQSTLTCAGSATDADADTTTFSFAWKVNGTTTAASSTGSASSTLTGAFTAGDLVACSVTASDGKSGTGTDTTSLTIGNTAPVVSSVTVSPTTVYTNDTLSATVSAADADGDTLSYTYAWYVDGTLARSGTSSTLSGLTYFNRDQDVTVTVTASDGVATDSATSPTVTVSNTPPTAPTIELTPADPVAGDALTCSVVTASTDADGDPITYTFDWDADGVAYTSAIDSLTDSVVNGADVGAGETWYCDVLADDGTLASPSTSDSVTVQNDDCYALSFDGVNDYVQFTGARLTDSNFTIEAWVYSRTDADQKGAFVQFGGLEFGKYFTSGTAYDNYLTMQANGSYNVTSYGAFVSSGTWHHVAVTHSASTGYNTASFTFFVDGVPYTSNWSAATSLFSFPTSTTGYMGVGVGVSTFYYYGYIDSIRVSSTIRYTSTFTPPDLLEADTNTTTLWSIDEATGSTVVDSVGGINGTIYGATWITIPNCSH